MSQQRRRPSLLGGVAAATVVVVLVLLGAIPCRCDDPDEQAFGGTPIGRDEYLWLAALLQGIGEDDFICSGALISPLHVLTADHCLRDRHVNSFWVRIGYFCPQSDNCLRTFVDRTVVEHRRDPSLGDVAILVLSSKVPSSSSSSSSSRFVPATPDVGSPSHFSSLGRGDEMLMVTAGRDGTSRPVAIRAETLSIQLRHTTHKKCGRAIRDDELRSRIVSASTVCSVSAEGKPCQGDSGSAILLVPSDKKGEEQDENVILAVHNYGPRDCSNANDESLFGHVAVSAVADFIVSVVCSDGGGAAANDKKKKKKTKKVAEWCPPLAGASSSPADTTVCTEEVCAPFLSCGPSTPICPLLPREESSSPNAPILDGDSLQVTLRRDDLTDQSLVVTAVAIDATSTRLASRDTGNRVFVWDPSKGGGGSPQKSFQLNRFAPYCCSDSLVFHPLGTILAVNELSNVVLLDVREDNDENQQEPPRKLQGGHTESVHAVSWHPNGSVLASGSADSSVRLWEVVFGTLLHTFHGHADAVSSLSFEQRQGRYLASASNDSTIRIWDVSTLTHVRTLQGHTASVSSVAFSPDGTRIASGGEDETVRIWKASDGSALSVFSAGSEVNSVAWSPQGDLVVSASHDGTLRLWNATATSGTEALRNFRSKKPRRRMQSVVWSPNGEWIAAASADNRAEVWDISRD